MIEWDNTWYEAWTILMKKLDLAEMAKLAAVFGDVPRHEEWIRTDEEKKGDLIRFMGDRLREMRRSEDYRARALPAFQAIKELMGIR